MKNLLIVCLLSILTYGASAQKIKPCETWLTGYVDVDPKMSDGSSITKYVVGKLQADTSLKSKASCDVGLMMYVNCHGEFSYERMEYSNNPLIAAKCSELLQSLEGILKGITILSPGKIGVEKKDFIFTLVVKIKHNGKPEAEILY